MNDINFISKISLFFLNKIRLTFLLLFSLLILGYLSYTQFLPREGFPNIQLNFIIISGNYQVNDKNKVNKEVTSIIEQEISQLTGIDKISSQTTDNTFNLVLTLSQEINDIKEFQTKVENKLNTLIFPDGVKYSITATIPGKFENEYDIVIDFYSINDEISIQELNKKAEQFANDLAKSDDIAKAKVIQQFSEQINPINGEKTLFRNRINKITIKENDELKTRDVIQIGLVKKDFQDLVRFSNSVNETIKQFIEADEYKSYQTKIVFDLANSVKKQISSLEQSAVLSIIIVLLVIGLLINLKAGLIIGIFVFLVITSTMAGLLFTGNSLNLISLFGLILVLGMFVDDAIVMVEAIELERRKGFNALESIRNAVNNVGIAKIAGSVTTILVFIPMLFISGILGEFTRLIPITVIMTLIISLLSALTIISAISALLLKKINYKKNVGIGKRIFYSINKFLDFENPLVDKLANYIASFIRYYLSNKFVYYLVLILSIAIIVFSVFLSRRLKFEIFPQSEDGNNVSLIISKPQIRPSIESQNELILKVDNLLKEKYSQYIQSISWQANVLNINSLIELTPKENRDKKASVIIDEIETLIENSIEGAKATIRLTDGGGPGQAEYPFSIQIFNDNEAQLSELSQKAKNLLFELEYENKLGEKVKVIDTLVGNINNIEKLNQKRFIQVQAKFDKKVDTQDIRNIQNIIINKLTEIAKEKNIDTKNLFSNDLGQQTAFLRSFDSAIIAFIVALIIMYLYLVGQYNSYSLPLLVFLAIPFTIPGVFIALNILNSPISFFILIGFITLSGIVVNNSIIFIDTAESNKMNYSNIIELIEYTTKSRFRPIISTSLTTILGLLPVAIFDDFWRGLASSIMFGLSSSVILVLLVFPAYYYLFDKIRTKAKNLIKKIIL